MESGFRYIGFQIPLDAFHMDSQKKVPLAAKVVVKSWPV